MLGWVFWRYHIYLHGDYTPQSILLSWKARGKAVVYLLEREMLSKHLNDALRWTVYRLSPTERHHKQVPFNTSLDEVLQCCRFLIAVITAWEQLSSHHQTFLWGESIVLLINSHGVILSGKTSLAGFVPHEAHAGLVPTHSGFVKQLWVPEPEMVPLVSDAVPRQLLQLPAAVTVVLLMKVVAVNSVWETESHRHLRADDLDLPSGNPLFPSLATCKLGLYIQFLRESNFFLICRSKPNLKDAFLKVTHDISPTITSSQPHLCSVIVQTHSLAL